MDFQSAMETFAEAWVAANTGKIGLGNISNPPPLPIGPAPVENRIESPLQQQLGGSVSKGAVANLTSGSGGLGALATLGGLGADGGGSVGSDYPKIPSGMDLSSSAGTTTTTTTTTSPPAKRLKGISTRKLSPSHNNNNNNNHHAPDFHSSSAPPLISHSAHSNIPNTLGKSMPIHCIIEVVSGSSNCGSSGGSSRRESITVETVLSAASNNNIDIITKDCSSTGKVVEVDDFVIIPAGTPFQDVVTTVLTLLGYPKDIIRQAEGTISLRNWKPLRLDQVCDSPNKTVGDILNDLTNHATLRVLVTRAKGGSAEDLKEKLLRLLLAHSSTLLMGAGCPLDEVTMSQLVKGQWPQNLAEDVKRRFDQWYKSQAPGTTMGLLESLQHSQMQQQQHQQQQQQQQQHHHVPHGGAHHPGTLMTGNNGSMNHSGHHHNHLVNGSGGHHHHQPPSHLHHHHIPHDLQSSKSSAFIDDDHNHPVFHGLTTQKTRMRTSFDPEMELPKLQQWFAENPHPSRHQIQQYVRELNLLDCRKDRKPLDVNNVIYWFKNARAAQKRNELRYNGMSPHHPSYSHHSQQQPQQLGQSSHSHLLHSAHGHGGMVECRDRGDRDRDRDRTGSQLTSSQAPHEISNCESGNENSGGSSCRDSDDPDLSKENSEDLDQSEEKENVRILRNIKEERDEDYVNVEVDGGGGGSSGGGGSVCVGTAREGSPRDLIKNMMTNNNEEPKDLSSKSPGADSGEDTLEEKVKSERHERDGERDHDNNHDEQDDMNDVGGVGIGIGHGTKKRSGEKSEVIIDDNVDSNPGVDMIRGNDIGDHDHSNHTTSSSPSPRSSPGLSPNHNYDFNGPPSMVSRFHPFFEHPSFMAYRHFNSFNFGPNFPGANSTEGAAYEAALSATRKSLLPSLGKPTSSLDIFHDFPQGLSPQLVTNGRGGSGGGGLGGGVSASCDPLSRLRAEELFPSRPASSADIISSIINSNRGEFSPLNLGSHHHNTQNSMALDERRKRNRTFIDPVTEVVLLENWFKMQTHPSHNLILKYTDELNRMPYRQKFPKLEPKNVQFWFKNRRAKCKRLKMAL